MISPDRTTGKWAAVQEALVAIEEALPSRGGIPGPAAEIRNVLKKTNLDEGDWHYIERIIERKIVLKSPNNAAELRAALMDVSDDFRRAEMEQISAFHEHPDSENQEMYLQ